MRLKLDHNTCTLWTGAIVIGLASMSGCNKLTPSGTSDTISLLQSGSERVCVAPEVQQALHELIVPKSGELSGTSDNASGNEGVLATAAVSLSFDATTLQATDKSVNKASCTTNVRIAGPNGASNRFRLNYEVSPSAEDPNRVVVSGDTDDARAFAKTQIDASIAAQAEAEATQQETAQAAQARQVLLAMITPKWLVGTWIPTGADAAGCSNGHSFAFRANHVLEGAELNGRWVLTEDHLHGVGQGAAGPAELDGTISAADPLSFTLTAKDDTTRSFRRCTRDEVNIFSSTGAPDTFAPIDPAQN